jgi:hypothetical protein
MTTHPLTLVFIESKVKKQIGKMNSVRIKKLNDSPSIPKEIEVFNTGLNDKSEFVN